MGTAGDRLLSLPDADDRREIIGHYEDLPGDCIAADIIDTDVGGIA